MAPYLIAALYRFVSLPHYASLQQPLFDFCQANQVTGTLLLAHEGINGTIAGPEAGIRAVLAYLRAQKGLDQLEHKESWAENQPFYRMKVKLKKEIVTMGIENIDPTTMAGEYVAASEWNTLISRPDVVVVDVRNDYEVGIGTFESAINPETTTFSEFPAWVQQQSQPGGVLESKKNVAMFCTGGIRCEKSTAYLKSQGFENVYHLQGGILKYLETIPEAESKWQGDCFVFDERVAVGQGLEQGNYEMCRGCRHPIGASDKSSAYYEEGVSCPHCYGSLSSEKRSRLRERQHQIQLSRQRHEQHIGVRVEIKKEQARVREEAARKLAQEKALERAERRVG